MTRVVVVGASVAGVTLVQGLRELGFAGEIVLLDAESGRPYQRPPLSKEVLLGTSPERADLVDEAGLESIGVDFRPGDAAEGIDVADRRLLTTRGKLPYDHVVIASGAAPTVPADLRHLVDDGAHLLRTRRDAAALAAVLRSERSLMVIGGGVLGSEICSAAVSAGLRTILLARPTPAIGPLHGVFAAPLIPLHRARGVEVRTEPARVDRSAGGWTADGGDHPALTDAVALAVGVDATAGWLASALPTTVDGVRCDTSGRVAPGVWAVGDVADRAGGRYDVSRRTQSAAIAQAREVARRIVGAPGQRTAVPYFWTDLHGIRVQAAGRIPPSAEAHVVERDDAGTPVAFAAVDRGRCVGAAAWGSARGFRRARAMLGDTTIPQEVSR